MAKTFDAVDPSPWRSHEASDTGGASRTHRYWNVQNQSRSIFSSFKGKVLTTQLDIHVFSTRP